VPKKSARTNGEAGGGTNRTAKRGRRARRRTTKRAERPVEQRGRNAPWQCSAERGNHGGPAEQTTTTVGSQWVEEGVTMVTGRGRE
jgi:hypothetical protein